MSPLSPQEILDPSVGWREKLASWVVQQGVSTVLLLGIFAGVYVGRTDVIKQIQAGYAENAASLERAVMTMDKQFDRVASQAEKREQLLIEVLRGTKQPTAAERDRQN